MRTIRFAGTGLALTLVAAGLTACGGGGGAQTEAVTGAQEDVLIKTHLTFDKSGQGQGEVASGSVIGDESFCEDGKFTDVFHQEGKGEGYLVKRFDCKDGTLEIRFTPQGNEKAQRGPWTIEGGSGAYDGFAGEGEMSVTFADRDNGEETFRGTVTR